MRKLLLGLIGLLFAIPVFAACPSGQVEQTYTSATGTVTQNGTPSPDNPIEPIFYQQGDMILRKINDTYADSYDATTGKITRRVGVKVLDGTENWADRSGNAPYEINIANMVSGATIGANNIFGLCSHFEAVSNSSSWSSYANMVSAAQTSISLRFRYLNSTSTLNDFKQYLADQYAAGTPVTVYYPLATETTEDWAAEQCTSSSPIKIATTAYNTARFSPVVTELNDTIATIRNVVTNTINQTKAIADLQATKQTRPDEQCPAGKKCLLVEDNNGQPHWYEIVESAD